MKRLLVLLVSLATFATVTFAKTKHAPLPETLLNAKSLYIDNQSGEQYLTDHVYSELDDWGHFSVVQDRGKADIIARITVSSVSRGATDHRSTVLTLLSPSGDVLWSDSHPWHLFGSAAKEDVRDLRHAFGN